MFRLIMGKFDSTIDGKINKEVSLFLHELKQQSPLEYEIQIKNWEDYKPELKKCESKDEVARLLISFFVRPLKTISKKLDGKTFHKLRYESVGRVMQCMYALRIHKNSLKDYVKHIHKIQGEDVGRGIRMADEKQFETPDEINRDISKMTGKPQKSKSSHATENSYVTEEPKRSITTKELKRRVGKKANYDNSFLETIAAAGFAIGALLLFVIKLLT